MSVQGAAVMPSSLGLCASAGREAAHFKCLSGCALQVPQWLLLAWAAVPPPLALTMSHSTVPQHGVQLPLPPSWQMPH